AGGFVPYDVSTSSISQLIATGLAGDDTLTLNGLGSGPGNPGITLSGGNDVDTLQVQSTSGHTGLVSLVGNAGSDNFLVYDSGNTVDNFIAPILVDGSDGSLAGNDDRLTIIDSGDLTADNVIISPVNSAVSQDYRIDGINAVVGNDFIFRNVDTFS